MARPGPLPNPNRIGHSAQADWTDVVDVPYKAGAKRELPKGTEWHERTQEWWRVVRTMPHAKLWTRGDWQAAADLAIIKQEFYTVGGNAGFITEMRKREDLLGLTTEARHKLRIRYVEPKSSAPTEPLRAAHTAAEATVTQLSARRLDLQ